MENTFVLQTDDKEFKKAISIFLSSHCAQKNVNVAIYELNNSGATKVMDIVKEK